MAQPDAATVEQAIRAFYGQGQAQEQANHYLNAFVNTQAAWGIAMTLLEATSVEVQFYSANLIYTKVKKEWEDLSQEQKASISSTLLNMMERTKSSSTPIYSPQAINSLATQTNNPCCISLAIDLLTVLPEEKDSAGIPVARKDELNHQLHSFQVPVVNLMSQIASTCTDQAQMAAILNCLSRWATLGLSITVLHTSQSGLYNIVLQSLQSPEVLCTPAADVICEALAVSEYPRPATRDAALQTTIAAVLAAQPAFAAAVSADDEGVCHAFTRVVVALFQAELEIVARGQSDQVLQLVEVALQCTANPQRKVAVLMLDSWLEIQDVPFAERHPTLREPLFQRLLSVILTQVTYPLDFTSWDDAALDEEDMAAFKKAAADILAQSYRVLCAGYFEQLMASLGASGGGASWQGVEAVLFAMHAVAADAQKHLTAASNPQALPDQQRTCAMLSQLFNEVGCNASLSSHQLVVVAACNLIGAFAQRELVGSLLQYLSNALMVAECDARSGAAAALKNMCTGCRRKLSQEPNLLEYVIDALEKASAAGLPTADRAAVTEGVTRVAAMLHAGPASAALEKLAGAVMARLGAALASAESSAGAGAGAGAGASAGASAGAGADASRARPTIIAELQLVAVIISFLDRPVHKRPDGTHLAVPLANSVWGMLEQASSLFRADETVVDAVLEVYCKMLRSLTTDMAPRLAQVAGMLVQTFQEMHFASALGCVAVCVEIFGKSSPEVEASFKGMLGLLCQASFQLVQARPPSEAPEFITIFFEMLQRFLLFCPSALFTMAELPTVFELACACVSMQERMAARAVLIFLSQFLSLSSNASLAPFAPQVGLCVQGSGEKLVRTLMVALAVSSPSVVCSHLAEVLYALVGTFTEQTKPWVYSALAMEELSARLGAEDKQRVLNAIYRLVQERKPRFKMMVTDFAKICRGEQTRDALLGYEM